MTTRYQIFKSTSSDSYNKNPDVFLIQRKYWYGWSTVKVKSDTKTDTLSFSSHKDAEEWLFSNIFTFGHVDIINYSTFIYSKWSYSM